MTRKELVKMLEEKYGTKAKYLGAPSLAYEITIRGAALTIDREGKVFNAAGMEVCAEELLNEEVQLDGIISDGHEFTPNQTAAEIEKGGGAGEINISASAETDCGDEQEPAASENASATSEQISIDASLISQVSDGIILLAMEDDSPRTLRNFTNMIFSNQERVKKALCLGEDILTQDFVHQVNVLSPQIFKDVFKEKPELNKEALRFDFNANVLELKLNLKPEKQNAALILFTLMYKTAQERRYVTFRPKTTTNEKYTFRTWLLSLGMKGEGYKAARKELLKELTGNSAFKNPKKGVENDE